MAPSGLTRGIQAGARHVLDNDSAREMLGTAVSEAIKSSRRPKPRKSDSGGSDALSGFRGILVGAGAAAVAPITAKSLGKLIKGARIVHAPKRAIENVTSKVSDTTAQVGNLGDKVSGVGDKLGDGVSAVKGALPGGGDDQDESASGHGKGRRMPVQQSIDVAVPVRMAYNQWTQFEMWPNFMHRVTQVSQEDDSTVRFATKIWGKTKEFTAEVETQRPDDRIKWHVTEGIVHTGVVTFHELGPRLTRIELSLDVEPGGMLEKAARGMRHIKRAARGDLHRFKAFIEMRDEETGGWRGTIENGKVKRRQERSGSSSPASKRGGSSSGASGRQSTRSNGSGKSNGSSKSASRSNGSSKSTSRSNGSSKSNGSNRPASRSNGSSKAATRSGRANKPAGRSAPARSRGDNGRSRSGSGSRPTGRASSSSHAGRQRSSSSSRRS